MDAIRFNPELLLRADDAGEMIFVVLQSFMAMIHGDSRLDVDALATEVCDPSLPSYLFSRKRLDYYIKLGEKKGFWRTTNHNSMHYIGKKKITSRYEGGYISTPDVTFNCAELFAGVNGPARWANVKAHALAAFYATRPHADRPIARETIESETSISQRRQRSYERRTNVYKEFQYALCEIDEETADFHVKSLASEGVHAWRTSSPDGQTFLARQLPNVYIVEDVVEKVHSKASRKRLNKVQPSAVCESRDALNPRRYFDVTDRQAQQTKYQPNEIPTYIKVDDNIWIDKGKSLLTDHYGWRFYS